MTRDEFRKAVWAALRKNGAAWSGAVQDVCAAADQYAAHEAERIAHPPYKPALRIDLGHARRSDRDGESA